MKITLDIPDSTRCVSVSLVFQSLVKWADAMAVRMIGHEDLKEGAEFQIPRAKDDEIA